MTSPTPESQTFLFSESKHIARSVRSDSQVNDSYEYILCRESKEIVQSVRSDS